MSISVASPHKTLAFSRSIRALVREALGQEGHSAGEIAVVLTDDPVLRDLNRSFRGLDRATDVLSFRYPEPGVPKGAATPVKRGTPQARSGAPTRSSIAPDQAASRSSQGRRRISGDIIVSLDRVVEQARRFRVPRGQELARLVVHGALHLAGLDHQTLDERRRMRAREERVLKRCRAGLDALDQELERSPRHLKSQGRGRND
jgi:probable rRNA maturation factor